MILMHCLVADPVGEAAGGSDGHGDPGRRCVLNHAACRASDGMDEDRYVLYPYLK